MRERDDDRLELSRLTMLCRQLQLPAYLYERYGAKCDGDCDKPAIVAIAPMPHDPITCCNLLPSYREYVEARRLERHLRRKLEVEERGEQPRLKAAG